jgi:hypothetical protein|tara:strand:- start:1383 stop:1838 length:456 start_codon:yes stop_codon:yes gene_type:complete
MSLTFKKTFKAEKITENLKDQMAIAVNKLANDVVKDHKVRLKKNLGVTGGLQPLAPSTVRNKRSKGSKFPNRPLVDEGIMTNIFVNKTATRDSLIATIIIPDVGNRREVSEYHQTGDGVPKREWFGITKKVRKNMHSYLSKAWTKAKKATK